MAPGNNPSPIAARELIEAVESGEITPFSYETDDYMGATGEMTQIYVRIDPQLTQNFALALEKE